MNKPQEKVKDKGLERERRRGIHFMIKSGQMQIFVREFICEPIILIFDWSFGYLRKYDIVIIDIDLNCFVRRFSNMEQGGVVP